MNNNYFLQLFVLTINCQLNFHDRDRPMSMLASIVLSERRTERAFPPRESEVMYALGLLATGGWGLNL